jgi:hypothetical protein
VALLESIYADDFAAFDYQGRSRMTRREDRAAAAA